MKQLMKSATLKNLAALLVLSFIQLIAWAQDTTSTTTTTTKSVTKSTDFFASPWVWVIGGAVFILLLVALLSGGRKSGRTDKVTVTKTVRTDTDTE